MAKPAPCTDDVNRHSRSFTSLGADIDLTAQSKCPKHSATGWIIYGGGSAGTLVLTGEDGISTTIAVGANQALPYFEFAAKTIVASGTSNIARVTVFWKTSQSADFNV